MENNNDDDRIINQFPDLYKSLLLFIPRHSTMRVIKVNESFCFHHLCKSRPSLVMFRQHFKSVTL